MPEGIDFSFTFDGFIGPLQEAVIQEAMTQLANMGEDILDPAIHAAAEEPHQNIDRSIRRSADEIQITWVITPPRPHIIQPTQARFDAAMARFEGRKQDALSSDNPLAVLEVRFKPPWLKFFWSSVGPHGQGYPGAPDADVYALKVHWKARYPPRREIYEPAVRATRERLAAILPTIGEEIIRGLE